MKEDDVILNSQTKNDCIFVSKRKLVLLQEIFLYELSIQFEQVFLRFEPYILTDIVAVTHDWQLSFYDGGKFGMLGHF